MKGSKARAAASIQAAQTIGWQSIEKDSIAPETAAARIGASSF